MGRVVAVSDAHKRGGRPRIRVDREAVLDALFEGQTVHSAALAGGVRYSTLLSRMAEDPDFRRQFDEARAMGRERRADELQGVLFKAAMKAEDNPRYLTSLFFALCNLAPDRWKRRGDHTVTRRRLAAPVSADEDAIKRLREALANALPEGDHAPRLLDDEAG